MINRNRKINLFFGLSILLSGIILAGKASAEDYFPAATTTIYPVEVMPVTTTLQTVNSTTGPEDIFVAYLSEPMIRVGIYKMEKKVLFTSPFPYSLVSGGIDRGVLPENEVATITYDKKIYKFESSSLIVTSSEYFRLVPGDLSNYFILVNIERHLSTRSPLNFNTYRGIFEYRYSPKSRMPYLINELLLENYVAGIAETSNGAPDEYIKALQIAARTYAYSNISPVPATDKRLFDVYASTLDQLYLGYNFESFNPRIAFFSAGTRGMMVTYKGKTVPTYYFSRSNGKTKTSSKQPWLKSVVAKYDKGKSMLGHGYGMSNQDAAARAKKDGWDYEKILKYYYTGVEIEKIYN